MIIDKSTHKNQKSKYICDRCGTIIEATERNSLYYQRMNTNPKKYCDLCDKCFRAFERGIKKGAKNANINL